MLQPRFALRQKKRVHRLLAHPRFRAAFDFLELRARVAPELAADLVFWREAQGSVVAALDGDRDGRAYGHDADGDEGSAIAVEAPAGDGAPARRRRRRRPRGGAGG